MNNEETQQEAAEPVGTSDNPALTLPPSAVPDLLEELNKTLLVLISATYYFDCLAILLLLRLLSQNQIKTGGIRVVLTASTVSIATHALRAIQQPAQREFWNHGGALVDFVGEKPPTRFKLLAMDCMILLLQLLYLTLWYKHVAAQRKSSPTTESVQNLEAEEAGIRADVAVENDQGIELQNLIPGQADKSVDGQEQDSTVVVRRVDLKEVFVNTGNSNSGDESGAAVRRFIERFNALRERRAALQAQTSTAT